MIELWYWCLEYKRKYILIADSGMDYASELSKALNMLQYHLTN